MSVTPINHAGPQAKTDQGNATLLSLADSGGSGLDKMWGQMQAIINNPNPSASDLAKLSALSSMFQMQADAINNAIKSVGQGEATLASKG